MYVSHSSRCLICVRAHARSVLCVHPRRTRRPRTCPCTDPPLQRGCRKNIKEEGALHWHNPARPLSALSARRAHTPSTTFLSVKALRTQATTGITCQNENLIATIGGLICKYTYRAHIRRHIIYVYGGFFTPRPRPRVPLYQGMEQLINLF